MRVGRAGAHMYHPAATTRRPYVGHIHVGHIHVGHIHVGHIAALTPHCVPQACARGARIHKRRTRAVAHTAGSWEDTIRQRTRRVPAACRFERASDLLARKREHRASRDVMGSALRDAPSTVRAWWARASTAAHEGLCDGAPVYIAHAPSAPSARLAD